MKKVRGIILSLVLLGSLFLIGPLSASAESVPEGENELFAIPVDITMTPRSVEENDTYHFAYWDIYFGGGTGIYNFSFAPDNGDPILYGKYDISKIDIGAGYSLKGKGSKFTWYPRVSVSSGNTASTSGTVYLYK